LIINGAINQKQSMPKMEFPQNYFVPCMNCNSHINIDEVEEHSQACVKVKEEVLKADSSNFSYHSIDLKLRKLKEHINSLLKTDNSKSIESDTVKDIHHFSSLNSYIEDATSLNNIDLATVNSLKKIVSNINTLVSNFKGGMSALILIERTRLLLLEKLNILKLDMKKNTETRRMNDKKSGGLKELEEKKKDMLTEQESIEDDKAFILSRLKARGGRMLSIDVEKYSDTEEDKVSTTHQKGPDTPGTQNYYINTINSEVEKGMISDGLSSGYNSSNFSDCDNRFTFPNFPSRKNSVDSGKQDYKEFTKLYLKVKFEQLYNKHEGQNIPQHAIWTEVVRNNIPKNEWAEFIYKELKSIDKYAKYTKRSSTRVVRNMEPISEEI